MRLLFSTALLLLGSALAAAGTIEGFVTARGKEGAEKPGGKDAGVYESRKSKFFEKVDYTRFKDFVVYIEGAPKEKPVPPAAPVRVVTQKNAEFDPHILPILAGTVVEWPNRDDILHNVFSSSELAPFDLGLYKDEIKRVTFARPGRVDVFCSIHSKMNCILLVLETPFFARTNEKGYYRLTDVPPGVYRVKAWHERLPALVQEVVVPESGKEAVKKDFVMTIQGLPKY